MQEHDNDRLEQFFRKAASRADVTFSEDDWKKLEARLDAANLGKTASAKTGSRLVASIVLGSIMLLSGLIWVSARYEITSFADSETAGESKKDIHTGPTEELATLDDRVHTEEKIEASKAFTEGAISKAPATGAAGIDAGNIPVPKESGGKSNAKELPQNTGESSPYAGGLSKNQVSERSRGEDEVIKEEEFTGSVEVVGTSTESHDELVPQDKAESNPSNQSSSDDAERNKQKAVVELPGAEEEKTREVEALVQEEHASEEKKHVASPRLSLLLSFAPDFSGTRMGQYSAPGKAFGAIVHYHFLDRWSISGGVLKNYKRYSGKGTEYQPPKGYWKYYTNGIVPETIDGSCSILEFPLMIQYTLASTDKSKWNIGAGVSSYIMQTESYEYNFDQPNPGAKERWDSRNSSRFLFNMLNFTIGYERQVLPGLMLGIEPYAKIPVEKIGWSNLRLFSSGASVTMRYRIVAKRSSSIPIRSRGPD